METKHIEVSPVRRMICGVQEMLEPETVTTIVRLGQSGWGPTLIVAVMATETLATRWGGLPIMSFALLIDRLR